MNELLGAEADNTFVIEASPATNNRAAVRQLLKSVVADATRRGGAQRIRQLEQALDASAVELAAPARSLAEVTEYIRWELEQDRQFLEAYLQRSPTIPVRARCRHHRVAPGLHPQGRRGEVRSKVQTYQLGRRSGICSVIC